jgi:hypothetical protein
VTPTLRVTSGPAAGQSRDVQQEVVIGRESADLTIPDSQVSRRHALVRPVEHGIIVEDLGSLNGTFVNGARIEGPATLSAAGTIRVGLSEIEVDLGLDPPTTVVSPPPRGTVRRIDPEPPAAESAPASQPVQGPPAGGTPPAAPDEPPRRRRWLRALPVAALVGRIDGTILS